MHSEDVVHRLAGGDIDLWAEAGSVMLKVREPHGDPVELGEGELDELIEVLMRLRRAIG